MATLLFLLALPRQPSLAIQYHPDFFNPVETTRARQLERTLCDRRGDLFRMVLLFDLWIRRGNPAGRPPVEARPLRISWFARLVLMLGLAVHLTHGFGLLELSARNSSQICAQGVVGIDASVEKRIPPN